MLFSVVSIIGLWSKKDNKLKLWPMSGLSIQGNYFSFIERNPRITRGNLQKILDTPEDPPSNRKELYSSIIMFGLNIKLNKRISVNSAMHSLMTFGSDYPIYLENNSSVPVLQFLQNYFDYLPTNIRPYAPVWIKHEENDYFVLMSQSPRVISDHLGQLSYICALADVPICTQFQLKSGEKVSLDTLLETEIKYADPQIHDAIWQTAALAYYRPNKRWRNLNGKRFSPLDFIESITDQVTGHYECGHMHPLISATYAIRNLEESYKFDDGKSIRIGNCKKKIDKWVGCIKDTLWIDGSISSTWYLNEKKHPRTNQEIIIYNGHALEWLTTYLDSEQLKSAWVVSIANRFCLAVIDSLRNYSINSDSDVVDLPFEYAPFCHGLIGLRNYCKKTELGIERMMQWE